jgi:glycosyltransferase involved in cell wall biosynthesis
MGMDVVITWYHAERNWEKVRQGLEDNLEDITRIVLACDHEEEPEENVLWDLERMFPGRWEAITQVHTGFGISRAVNRGVEQSPGPKILHMDDDIVLYPGVVEELEWVVAPGIMVVPLVNTPTTLDRVPTQGELLQSPYLIMRGAVQAFYKDDFVDVGGWNESMLEYGCQDYEFGLRWLTRFGPRSITFAGTVNHLGETTQGARPEEGGKNWLAFRAAMAGYWRVPEEKVYVRMNKP